MTRGPQFGSATTRGQFVASGALPETVDSEAWQGLRWRRVNNCEETSEDGNHCGRGHRPGTRRGAPKATTLTTHRTPARTRSWRVRRLADAGVEHRRSIREGFTVECNLKIYKRRPLIGGRHQSKQVSSAQKQVCCAEPAMRCGCKCLTRNDAAYIHYRAFALLCQYERLLVDTPLDCREELPMCHASRSDGGKGSQSNCNAKRRDWAQSGV